MPYIDNVVVDGTEDGVFQGEANNPPFALFSPDLQSNIGGPYAKKEHAQEALQAMKERKIHPFFSDFIAARKWNENDPNFDTD